MTVKHMIAAWGRKASDAQKTLIREAMYIVSQSA